MRKTICILGLVAITVLASASDVFAQRGGRYGGGRGGMSVGRGGVGFGSGFYGSGYGSGYYGPGYSGSGYYRQGYVTPYLGSQYYTDPGYYYGDAVTQAPPIDSRPSFYADPDTATITVIVPEPNAQVWFNDAPTSQRGMERLFNTPALQQAGAYTIKARWTENGRNVDQQRQVQVQPGQSITVNFKANPPDKLPAPLPPND